MNILVTFALKAEFAPWERRRDFRRLPGESPYYEAEMGNARIRAVLTGMGQAHALQTARRVLAERPDICISTGLAGGLRDQFCRGDVLVARLVSEVGEPLAVAGHRELLSSAVECGAHQIERLVTSPTLVASAEEKRALGAEGEAVEMESYAILAEAARHGVPAVAIRAISDTVNFNMPYDFERARDAQGQIRVAGILRQVLRRPSGLPALLGFSRDCRVAAWRLAAFLDAYTGMLADRLIPIEESLMAAL